MSIAESMSYKIPLITTTGTPWQEIKEINAGWWVELNQQNIDNALNEALNCSEKELKIKGSKCYEIIKKYSWKKQALKMKQTYENILY